jgi:hypothetical protein
VASWNVDASGCGSREQSETLLDHQYTPKKKNEGQKGKIGLFPEWVQWKGGWASGKGKWDEYGGYML